MTTMSRSIVVRRPVQQVARVLGDPSVVMAVIGDHGRAARVEAAGDGAEQWEVFLVLGTMYMGGRVRIDEAGDGALAWHAVSGFQHEARFEAAAHGVDATITVHFEFRIEGLLTGRLAARLVRGYIGRYAESVLESLRHRIEYGETGRQ
ncbi:SRPBCC family protein [Tomitella fengzijianii]|uniref:SRPBCC family protein n=1 Tax=Tomitella fengzijianii TaxID=2597660 RepID=UPI00131C89D2|nr:SRPBCC family protein [Tomitella fengzijianii]